MIVAGQKIGPYRLLAPIGSGAMGEVWRARDERLDRLVALKVMAPGFVDGDDRRARATREARAVAAVHHPGVVTLYDVLGEGDELILVMELVEGRALGDHLRGDGAMSTDEALRVLGELTAALAYAHERGILHRDIKSANVMLAEGGAVKVLDFGLAKLLGTGGPIAGDAWLRPGAAAAPAASMGPARSGEVALGATMPSEPRPRSTPAAAQPGGGDATLGGATPRLPAAASAEAGGGDVTLGGATPRLQAAASAEAGGGDVTLPDEPRRISATLPSQRSDGGAATMPGALLGTPLYMAPELLAGGAPDERTEVFAVGVVAHEIVTGRSPYAATTLEALFGEIEQGVTPAMDGVWPPLAAVIGRAMAHDRAARPATMRALHGELAALARRRHQPRRALAVVLGLAAVALLAGGIGWATRRAAAVEPAVERPGDRLVARALEEYDLFYGDKAAASLRAALKAAPEHARALAYLFLFEAGGERRDALVATARRIVGASEGRDGHLLRAGLALATAGPAAARDALPDDAARGDRELAFWRAELAYRARRYDEAEAEFRALLGDPARAFRGRIYDHQSAVLLYAGKVDEALAIGRLYAEAFPGEADALGVHATTLAAAGHLDDALAAAREAALLHEGEDTLAGLAKVHAYRGELSVARDLYLRSMQRATDARRPVRRAALALMHLALDDRAAARATVEPCLPGGVDATIRERGPCLLVAGLVDDAWLAPAAAELEALAASGTPLAPPYGFPGNLAQLLRARQLFDGGGCLLAPRLAPPPTPEAARDAAARLAGARDFYAEYHLPFFNLYPLCERAALRAATGDRPGAAMELEAALARTRGPTPLTILAAELAPPPATTARARLTDPTRRWPALDPASTLANRLAALGR